MLLTGFVLQVLFTETKSLLTVKQTPSLPLNTIGMAWGVSILLMITICMGVWMTIFKQWTRTEPHCLRPLWWEFSRKICRQVLIVVLCIRCLENGDTCAFNSKLWEWPTNSSVSIHLGLYLVLCLGYIFMAGACLCWVDNSVLIYLNRWVSFCLASQMYALMPSVIQTAQTLQINDKQIIPHFIIDYRFTSVVYWN